MAKAWKLRESQTIFHNKWLKLRQDTVELPNGQIIDDYFVIERAEVAIMFALTPNQEVILVRQYKHGAQVLTLELPAGAIEDDTALAAAVRELREETGYACDEVIPLSYFHDDPTRCTNKLNLFFGRNAQRVGAQELDGNEAAGGVDVLLVPIAELRGLIRNGEIRVVHNVGMIYRVLDWLEHEDGM